MNTHTEKPQEDTSPFPVGHAPKRLTFACSGWGGLDNEEKYELRWGPSTLHIEVTENKITIFGPNFYVEGSEGRPECNAVTLLLGIPERKPNTRAKSNK